MINQRLSLAAISLIALLITTVAVPEAFAREGGDVYTGQSGSTFTPQSDPNACDTLVGQPDQCAVFPDAANLPPPILAVIEAQGGAILNPVGCEVVVISSGDVFDIGPILSTDMLGDTCRDDSGNPETNPDGFETFDCATINVTPDQDALIFFWSVEYPEFLNQDFTDWDRIQNGLSVSVSINDMVGQPTLNEDPNFNGGESNTLLASITEGTIGAGQTVGLRVADSGDEILDSGKIIIPIACLEEPQSPLLCGNDQDDPGETCDDGNTNDGDGCSSLCLLEDDNGDGNGDGNGDDKVVGGEILRIDSTALMLAGLQTSAIWMLPVLAGFAGSAFGVLYIKSRRN